ncbi:MAG: gamma-glutamyltransferase, partial [Rhodospirillaceae bacterium]|nr:gamma-glutamyltransferase [Rhodospirillaceae bacterium]
MATKHPSYEGESVPPPSLQPAVIGRRYMASTGHYLATEAAIDILQGGGNAVDAGVSACITLGVVQSDQVQFGGVAPIMVYLAEMDEVLTISGLGWWPKAASLDYFVNECGGEIPIGVRRTVVPAAPDAYIQALSRYGTMSFGDAARHAIRCAREGIALHRHMKIYIERHAERIRNWPGNAECFLPDGRIPEVGDLFVQRDLAATLQYMADEEHAAAKGGRESGLAAARDAFYKGDIAQMMVAFQRENGGWLTADDLAGYASAVEPPVAYRYRGIDIYSCGPWCQGPVVPQALSLLEGIDLETLGHNTPEYIHAVAEAIKLAFADRERHYGDPRFVDVPIGALLDSDYAAERRKLIRSGEAWTELPPAGSVNGGPDRWAAPAATRDAPTPVHAADTSYAAVIDGGGNVFSATPSDTSWDAPVVPGLGFTPSARGSQSFAVPGHASCVAPGKRPRLTPNPAIALKRGEFAMPFGASGGDTQPQGMLQVLLNHVVFGMDIQAAIDAPRLCTHSQPDSFEPHTAYPARLALESRIDRAAGDRLAALGHDVDWLRDISIGVGGA